MNQKRQTYEIDFSKATTFENLAALIRLSFYAQGGTKYIRVYAETIKDIPELKNLIKENANDDIPAR